MFNISFITCIKRYIGHNSLENLTLSGQNGCLTPSYSVTQPPNLGLWLSRSSLVFIYFGQNVTRTKNHVIIWQFVTRTQSHVIFQFSKYVFFYSINEENNSVMYLFFLIFLKKKISGDSIPLTQKERCPKKHSKNLSFLRGTFFEISHTYAVYRGVVSIFCKAKFFCVSLILYIILPSVVYVYCLPSNWVVFVNT